LATQILPTVAGANKKAFGLILNSHWINGTDETQHASVKIKIMPAKPHTVKRYLTPIFEVVANGFLKVPPHQVSTLANWSWAPGEAPGRSILDQFAARKNITGGAAKRCTQAGPDAAECPASDPAFPDRTFTGNCVEANLVFGFTSDDDMCILPGAYYDWDPVNGCDLGPLPVIN